MHLFLMNANFLAHLSTKPKSENPPPPLPPPRLGEFTRCMCLDVTVDSKSGNEPPYLKISTNNIDQISWKWENLCRTQYGLKKMLLLFNGEWPLGRHRSITKRWKEIILHTKQCYATMESSTTPSYFLVILYKGVLHFSFHV